MTMTVNYGKLMNYTTGEYIRPAALSELRQSLEAAASTCDETGAFLLDGQFVYVEGESNEAHKLAGGKGHAE